MKTTYDERKFTELLVYVASRLRSDRSGGATKLNKILFFADFAHVRRTGAPITGAMYQKLEHGPAARRLRPVRDQLIANGEAELRDEEFLGYQQHRLVTRREPDLTVFTDDELATIDKVLADLDGLNARQVSDLSHEEAGWRLVDFGDDIPYEAALVGARQIATPTTRRLEREAAERLGLLTT
ncbi:MAG: Panacea domain-containing protein [Ilumatobacteraceae bacterium]